MKFKNQLAYKILFSLLLLSASAHAYDGAVIQHQYLEPSFVTEAPTPLLVDQQFYLGEAPLGVEAVSAWSLPGGEGQNVKIIDIETGMNPDHEDLPELFHLETPTNSHHGTAVMGILGALDNAFGITGIANKAEFGFLGFIEGNEDVSPKYIVEINRRIRDATALLSAGDVLVIEQQITGPKGDYILVEYWDEIFNELKKATDKGIHCVQAAGNGASNLDHEIYANLLDRTVRDSGCIVVGAGGMNGKNRLGFSNYGSIVDAFGYGRNVTATGYGDAFMRDSNSNYTHQFSGTSSATPIVAGAVALVSSIAQAQGRTITPVEMRTTLRNTGSPQSKKQLIRILETSLISVKC